MMSSTDSSISFDFVIISQCVYIPYDMSLNKEKTEARAYGIRCASALCEIMIQTWVFGVTLQVLSFN
jgi:hypothetical protein